jgi:hypothetical protein
VQAIGCGQLAQMEARSPMFQALTTATVSEIEHDAHDTAQRETRRRSKRSDVALYRPQLNGRLLTPIDAVRRPFRLPSQAGV